MQPMMSACVRLSIDSSMKVAGRKIVESISMPGRPGFNAASASSMPRVTSSVLAHGSFSTINIRPRSSLMTASPTRGHVSQTTLPTSPSRGGSARLPLSVSGTAARCSVENTGDSLWMAKRWLGVSIIPSMRALAPVLYDSRPISSASAVVSMTSFSVTLWARIRLGSTCTCSDLIRSPHMGMLATPGTDISRNLTVQ